jgi:hypothetical protein
MMFQQGENSYDITLLCMSGIGLILLVGYIAFSYFVTHRGDFYRIRRWKASIWSASIFGCFLGGILGVPLYLGSTVAIISSSSARNIFGVIGVTIGGFLSLLAFILPFVFMVCLGTHHHLKPESGTQKPYSGYLSKSVVVRRDRNRENERRVGGKRAWHISKASKPCIHLAPNTTSRKASG